MTSHTKEPWAVSSLFDGVTVNGSDCLSVADCHIIPDPVRQKPTTRANARRIVAAVNATTGIPTEHLETGAVQEMREALNTIHAWLVCAPIATDDDMGASFSEMEQVAFDALAQAEQAQETE